MQTEGLDYFLMANIHIKKKINESHYFDLNHISKNH